MFLTILKNVRLRDAAHPLVSLLIRDGALAYLTIFGAHLHIDLALKRWLKTSSPALQIVTIVSLLTGNVRFEVAE